MKFFGVKELQLKNKDVTKALREDRMISVTNHGKPYAIMIGTNEGNYLESIKRWTGLLAMEAMREIQQNSVKHGLDKMTLTEINAEIAASRREPKTRARRH